MSGTGTGILLAGVGQSGYVEPDTLTHVAELIECEESDLTFLRYGKTGVMWMARSRQTDESVPLNKDAALILQRMHGLPMSIRGAVVAFPRGMKFDARFPYRPFEANLEPKDGRRHIGRA
jgi:hypothetical protein